MLEMDKICMKVENRDISSDDSKWKLTSNCRFIVPNKTKITYKGQVINYDVLNYQYLGTFYCCELDEKYYLRLSDFRHFKFHNVEVHGADSIKHMIDECLAKSIIKKILIRLPIIFLGVNAICIVSSFAISQRVNYIESLLLSILVSVGIIISMYFTEIELKKDLKRLKESVSITHD